MASLWAQLRREPFTGLAAVLTWLRRDWLAAAAAVCWLVGVLVARQRLPYGVNHTDEAYYSALSYEFLIGNRPYLDEIAIHQNAGLLLVPFFWVYLAINKTADGIVLFNRYLYWAYVIVCSLLAFRLLRRLMGVAVACAAGALIVTFSYANLLTLSYNTFGALGFFCGVVCSATGVLRPRPGPFLFAGCLFFLSAAFAYPGLTPVVPVYELVVLGWLYWRAPRAALRSSLFGLAAGAAVGVVVMGPIALWLGLSGLHRMLAYMQSAGIATTSSFGKLNVVNVAVFPVHWRKISLEVGGLCALLPITCWLLPRTAWLLAPVFAYVAHRLYDLAWLTGNTPVSLWQMALLLLAPLCVLLNRQWRDGHFLLALVWFPSFLEMLDVVVTSSNGYWAMSLGSLGATVAGVASFVALLQQLARREPRGRLGLLVVGLTAYCLLFGAQLDSLFSALYDADTTFATHNTPVSVGPFQGAIATASEAAFLKLIDEDLKSLEGKGKTLTVFDDFATGYLSTRLRPRTFTPWVYWGLEAHYMARLMDATFGRPDQLPDFVLKIHLGAVTQAVWSKYERDLYRPIINRPQYKYGIFQRVALPPGPPPEMLP
ncbi:MAG: hypothetical protein ABJB12_24590 [Pseudomonadota bacterium]